MTWMEGVVQFIGIPGQAMAGKMISSFKDYPPRQTPASFNLDEVMRAFASAGEGK